MSYTTDDGVSHTESGRFQYRELGDTEQLDLLTPLNGILARIEVKPNMTCLSKSVESTPVCRASAAELLYSILGFSIPVEHFGDLVKTGKLPLSVEESYVWQVQVKSKHPDGRAKLLQVTPKVPLNVRSLSVVTD